jgi:hypothetical protein
MESKKKVYEPPVVVRLSQVGKMTSAEGQSGCTTGNGIDLPDCLPGSAARLCNAGAGITYECTTGAQAGIL